MTPLAVSTSNSDNERNGGATPSIQVNGAYLNGLDDKTSSDELLDLLCIGFGPASLAIAIALSENHHSPAPRTLFLEKQPRFGWHSGMQLPAAKMQISFLKDLATPRNPRSRFTFLNYLFSKGRLNNFINLGTFLPSREEYEDYLRWCAEYFESQDKVMYGVDVLDVTVGEWNSEGKVASWAIRSREDGKIVERRARHVVIAVGGRPVVPDCLSGLKRVTHSSSYAQKIKRVEKEGRGKLLRFAVIGSGQSAAEIFDDLWDRFPQASVKLIIKGASLRPSDDSPFVNEIFDPDRVSEIYHASSSSRAAAIAQDRGTNYGVVRPTLLEHLYEKQYLQRVREPNPLDWRCMIIPYRTVVSASQLNDSSVILKLAKVGEVSLEGYRDEDEDEELEVDYIFTATGYVRNAHEEMLREIQYLLPDASMDGKIQVERNYRVRFDAEKVDDHVGIWLQGCNESTHGLSDTLLSILAVRGGELVKSIFG